MKQFVLLLIVAMAATLAAAADQPAPSQDPPQAQPAPQTAPQAAPPPAQPPAKPAQTGSDDFWKEDWGPDNFPKITDDRINQLLVQIRSQNPARADELEKLRKDNFDEFRNQLRTEIMNLYRQQPQPGQPPHKEPEPAKGPGPEAKKPEPGSPQQPGPRPESGSPQRWRERWERRHDDFIAWLEKNYPYEANALKQLREKEADKYTDRVMEKMKIYDPIRDAEKKNPKLAQVMKDDLELQIIREKLLDQIRKAEEKDKEKLMAELKDNVSRRFDIIIARKQLQYEDVKKRLEDLQKEVCKQEKELEQLKNNKDKAVQEHLDELLEKAGKMDWK